MKGKLNIFKAYLFRVLILTAGILFHAQQACGDPLLTKDYVRAVLEQKVGPCREVEGLNMLAFCTGKGAATLFFAEQGEVRLFRLAEFSFGKTVDEKALHHAFDSCEIDVPYAKALVLEFTGRCSSVFYSVEFPADRQTLHRLLPAMAEALDAMTDLGQSETARRIGKENLQIVRILEPELWPGCGCS